MGKITAVTHRNELRNGSALIATCGGSMAKDVKIKNAQPINGEKASILEANAPDTRWVKKTAIICVVLAVAFFAWQCHEMNETSLTFLDEDGVEHAISLPLKDKKRLYCFMHMLFAEDNFAYTLLGSKPVSWGCYKNPFPFDDWSMFYDTLKTYHGTLRAGWKTWLKYCHLFPSATLWAENSESHPGWISILLVNEERFNQVVSNHKKDFQDVLKREIVDGFQLLREAKNRPLMSGILKGHQALMGIVLGYGRDNSWKFLKGIETKQPLECVWDETNERIPGVVQTRLNSNDNEAYLFLDSCPSFAGDPHSEESLALKADYLLTKDRVVNYYKDKDFLEATLSLLAGFRPSADQ